jgi:hypothetical protein
VRLKLGVGGRAFGVRGGVSNRGFGAGIGPLSAGAAWPRRRRSRRSSSGGLGGLVIVLLPIAWLVSLCSPSQTNTATTPHTSVTYPAVPPTAPGNRVAVAAVTLPDMAGRNAKDAEDQLKSLGLVDVELVSTDPKYNVVLVPSIWKVATTNPPAGSTVETSDRVVVNVEDYADGSSRTAAPSPQVPATVPDLPVPIPDWSAGPQPGDPCNELHATSQDGGGQPMRCNPTMTGDNSLVWMYGGPD